MDEYSVSTRISNGVETDEDFGFVKRDSELLVKALTRTEPPPPSSADDVHNKDTGNNEQQVASPTGCDEETAPDEDVTSVGTLESISEDGAASSEEAEVLGDDPGNARKLGGTLKDLPEADSIGHVYDASKRKATVVSVGSTVSQKSGKAPGPGILRNMSSGALTNKQIPAPVPVSKDDDLPQTFQVKYLGQRDAGGLWGIKHTRKPVDAMVTAAKNLKPGTVLPIVKLVIHKEGVSISQVGTTRKKGEEVVKFHPIDTISYGVQDLVYTRVFSMIVVRETGDLKGHHPFECHAFVCDSRNAARKLTYALASAFHEYSKLVKARVGDDGKEGLAIVKKKFAIDLRSPEEIEADLKSPQAEDSEA